MLCHKYNISTTTFSSQVWIEPTQNWRSDKQKGKQTAFLIRICILTFWICIASLLCVIYQSVTTLGSINIFYFFLLMICLKAFIYKILWTINFFFLYVYLTLFNLWTMFCIAHGTYRYRLTRLAMQLHDWYPVGQFLIYQNKTFKILNLFQINCSSLCEGVTVIYKVLKFTQVVKGSFFQILPILVFNACIYL